MSSDERSADMIIDPPEPRKIVRVGGKGRIVGRVNLNEDKETCYKRQLENARKAGYGDDIDAYLDRWD